MTIAPKNTTEIKTCSKTYNCCKFWFHSYFFIAFLNKWNAYNSNTILPEYWLEIWYVSLGINLRFHYYFFIILIVSFRDFVHFAASFAWRYISRYCHSFVITVVLLTIAALSFLFSAQQKCIFKSFQCRLVRHWSSRN